MFLQRSSSKPQYGSSSSSLSVISRASKSAGDVKTTSLRGLHPSLEAGWNRLTEDRWSVCSQFSEHRLEQLAFPFMNIWWVEGEIFVAINRSRYNSRTMFECLPVIGHANIRLPDLLCKHVHAVSVLSDCWVRAPTRPSSLRAFSTELSGREGKTAAP